MSNKTNYRRNPSKRNATRTEYHSPDPYKFFFRLDRPQYVETPESFETLKTLKTPETPETPEDS